MCITYPTESLYYAYVIVGMTAHIEHTWTHVPPMSKIGAREAPIMELNSPKAPIFAGIVSGS